MIVSKSTTHPSRSLILCRFPAGGLPRGHFALVRREGIFRTTCVCLEMGSESGTDPSRGCKSVEFQAGSINEMICPCYAQHICHMLMDGDDRRGVVRRIHDGSFRVCHRSPPCSPPPPCSDHVCVMHAPDHATHNAVKAPPPSPFGLRLRSRVTP